MGINTNYVGQVLIEPLLSAAETAYLTAFSDTRHNAEVEQQFRLPGNPMAASPPVENSQVAKPNRVAAGRPSYWCPWTPCFEGHCLRANDLDTASPGEAWLRYLIDTFLRPSSIARSDRSGALTGFTFDHNLNGVLVGSPEDTCEVFALRVRNNTVSRQQLMAPLALPAWDAAVDWQTENEHRRADRDGSWEQWLLNVEADARSSSA